MFSDSGTEKGDSQVVRLPRAEAGYFGTDTDNAQVGGGPREGEMLGVGLGAAV